MLQTDRLVMAWAKVFNGCPLSAPETLTGRAVAVFSGILPQAAIDLTADLLAKSGPRPHARQWRADLYALASRHGVPTTAYGPDQTPTQKESENSAPPLLTPLQP